MKHLFLALILSASAIVAQQPKVVNTQFNTEPAGAGLSATVARFQRSNQPLWIGYEVPALPRTNFSSCSDSEGASQSEDGCCGEYQLESTRDGMSTTDQKPSPVNMYVLVRLDHGAITKIRPANAGCRLNAGGVPFTWLTGVQPNDSVAFLAKLAAQPDDNQGKRITEDALVTLAMHATPTATETLASLAAPSNTATPPRKSRLLARSQARTRRLPCPPAARHQRARPQAPRKTSLRPLHQLRPRRNRRTPQDGPLRRQPTGPRPGHLLASPEGRQESLRRHHRSHRKRPRTRRSKRKPSSPLASSPKTKASPSSCT